MSFPYNLRRNIAGSLTGSSQRLQVHNLRSTWYIRLQNASCPNYPGRDKDQQISCGYASMFRTGATWTNSRASISAQWGTLVDLEILFGSRYGLGRHEISFIEQIWEDSASRGLDRRTRGRQRWDLVCFIPFSNSPTPNSGIFTLSLPLGLDAGASGCKPDDRAPAPPLRPDQLSLHSSPRDYEVVLSTVTFSVFPCRSSNFT